ncbi:MAG: alanine racemase [Gemmatimonadaceae bacterium]|nr:alanine racemase [Gemmatimonadaceae bacterium]
MSSGMLEELETPIPVVDLDIMERNMDRMARYTLKHSLNLRPHTKTHKSPWIAAEQVKRGAIGVTCATPREAEAMSTVTADILLGFPAIGERKARRIASIPKNVDVTVALDSETALMDLAQAARKADRAIGVYVELDLGMHRVGISSAEQAAELAMLVTQTRPLEYAGIAFYPGHIRSSVGDQGHSIEMLSTSLEDALEVMDSFGVRHPVVSGGSTPTVWRSHEIRGMTEIRPGTYVFNDRTTAIIGACDWADCALTVLATVISTAVEGQAVIDAGTKSLGREPIRGTPGEGFGSLLEHPEVTVRGMSEEHGILELKDSDWKPEVGERVRVIPNHVCIVVHLFDELVGMRGTTIEKRWPVAARGR